MPLNKVQLRRRSAIVHILNNGQIIQTKVLQQQVSELIDIPVCKSTIEKDLFFLREEMDAPIVNAGRGIKMEYKIPFLKLLANHLNLIQDKSGEYY